MSDQPCTVHIQHLRLDCQTMITVLKFLARKERVDFRQKANCQDISANTNLAQFKGKQGKMTSEQRNDNRRIVRKKEWYIACMIYIQVSTYEMDEMIVILITNADFLKFKI